MKNNGRISFCCSSCLPKKLNQKSSKGCIHPKIVPMKTTAHPAKSLYTSPSTKEQKWLWLSEYGDTKCFYLILNMFLMCNSSKIIYYINLVSQ